MYRYLFFDDQALFVRENLTRVYGDPQPVEDAVYFDGACSTDLSTPWVFRLDDGRYRMLYYGNHVQTKATYCCVAVSEDGIHFRPDTVRTEPDGDLPPHALFEMPYTEIACVVEDRHNAPEERYKMLLSTMDGTALYVRDRLLVSPDLLHWREWENVEWNHGAEPVVGVFYNEKRDCFTIMTRPFWGIRRVGYLETKDWRTYTPYELCLQCDSLDDPLAEIYGMPSFCYHGWYLGFPYLYHGFSNRVSAKFSGGILEAQLAYSWDGHHWQRSLRTPFLSGVTPQSEQRFGRRLPMMWLSYMLEQENGDLLLYAASSENEHGNWTPGSGRIRVFRLRRDGFIRLVTDDPTQPSRLATRENIWLSGELHINLTAENATVAVYESTGEDNLLADCHPLPGYTHEDCLPFAGDSTDWIPQFKNGRTVAALAGKTLAFEIRLNNGALYSLSGDTVPVMNTTGARFRKFRAIPSDIPLTFREV